MISPFCAQTDTLEHRRTECENFDPVRQITDKPICSCECHDQNKLEAQRLLRSEQQGWARPSNDGGNDEQTD